MHRLLARFNAWINESWSPLRAYLWSALPLLVIVTLADLNVHARVTSPWVRPAGLCVVFLAVVVEVVALAVSVLQYLRRHVFAPPNEHADRLIDTPGIHEQIEDLVNADDEVTREELEPILDTALHADSIATQACKRLAFVGIILGRLWSIFTLAYFAVILLDFGVGHHRALIGQFLYKGPDGWVYGLARLFERCAYANIVTLSTVGFGDLAPNCWELRLLVDIEILAGFVLLALGLNVIAALVMDNSGWAWAGRRLVVEEHVLRTIKQRRRLAPPPVGKPATTNV